MPNPKLRRVPVAEMTERLRNEHAATLKLRDDATLIEVGANAPELMAWYREEFYAKLFYAGRVDVRTKELVRSRLSMTHGCAFCNKGNSVAARKAGVTEEQLSNVMNELHAVFDAKDRAALKLADQIAMTNMNGLLDRPLLYALHTDSNLDINVRGGGSIPII